VAQRVPFHKVDLRKLFTLALCDLDRRLIRIDCIDPHRDSPCTRPATRRPGTIPSSRAEIEHAVAAIRIPPPREEAAHQAMTSRATICRLQRREVQLEFR